MEAKVRIFLFRAEIPFSGKFGPKNQSFQLKTFQISCLDHFEYAEFISDVHFFCYRMEVPFFWANLVQKIKVVGLS